MILYRWQGPWANFGDELNTILWPRLLPGFFDGDPGARFMGIGSVLDARHPRQPLKLVAGSGYGGYEKKPRLDRGWIIHWVRGPRTAAALGLPPALGLGDPAALVPQALDLPLASGLPLGGAQDIGFMPHFESAARGAWQLAAAAAGVRLIDPRGPPLQVLREIAQCKLLLSEALHGVIVADALRVPWIAIRPLAPIHRAKWADWAASMDVAPRFHRLPASTMTEWVCAGPMSACHTTRAWLGRHERRLERAWAERLVARAGVALRKAAEAEGQLSSPEALDRCQSRMLDAVHALRMDPLRGAAPTWKVERNRSDVKRTGSNGFVLPVTG